MQNDSFENLIKNSIKREQSELANILKMLVYKTDPVLFNRLDFSDDSSFLEPLLFAFFTTENSSVPLEQILYGYIEDSHKPDTLRVFSNQNGTVYLANIGYLQTSLANQELLLLSDKATGKYYCQTDDKVIPTKFNDRLQIEETTIEIFRCNHPMLVKFFTDDQGHEVDVEVEKITQQCTEYVNTAFKIIKNYCQEYYDAITAVTRKILIYRSGCQNSFATFSAHGIGFFNANDSHNEIFFLDDIAHQCGHVIFNTITREKERFLAIDPSTPLYKLNGDEHDPRSVYSAFHGIFTFAIINRILDTCYEKNLFFGKKWHELLGRLSFNMKKFKVNLVNLDHPAIFNESGWIFYEHCQRIYQEIYAKRKFIIDLLDHSNQPYVFSYDKFSKYNPLSRTTDLLSGQIQS